MTTETFVDKARSIHGDLYDYSNVEYKNSQTKVHVRDPDYGDFWVTPSDHLYQGTGHPQRGFIRRNNKNRSTTAEFIDKAKRVHGTLYDYAKVNYHSAKTKVCIIDPEYGEFWQTPNDHLRGRGHPERGRMIAREKRSYDKSVFISKARLVHGDLYDYSKVDYTTTEDKVLIIDPQYGEFWQKAANHLQGNGHPQRGIDRRAAGRILTHEEFVERADKIHNGVYDYSEAIYVTAHTALKIIDPIYGEFWQTPNNHLAGTGHPTRARTEVSKPEKLVGTWLDELGVSYLRNDRVALDGLEIDYLVGSVGVEVDGLYYHSARFSEDRQRHQRKLDLATQRDIQVLQFYDEEILTRPHVVRSIIAHKLGVGTTSVYARNTEVRPLSGKEYRGFLENTHLQGAINSKIRLGLYLNDELLAVLGVSKRGGYATIDRFSTRPGYRVVGGFTKLLRNSGITGVVRTHSANRYSDGGLYQSNGFSLVSETKYTLGYTDGRRYLSRYQFQKHKLASRFPEYNGENVADFLRERGIYAFYGAGVKTWETTL